jgi:ABC-type antimicrobial peptide transport system permease subunit
VAQRRSEIGLRMALGARPGRVLGMVVGGGVRLALLGVAVGVVAALGVTQILSGMLYGVTVHDPSTFGGVALLLLAVAALASGLPAVRATRIDPMLVLRD